MDKSFSVPEFHMGKLIKEELTNQGRTAIWLSKQVCCTTENIYKIFAHQFVTLPMLFKISQALKRDFFRDCSEYLRQSSLKK